jgi:hypothetical protein
MMRDRLPLCCRHPHIYTSKRRDKHTSMMIYLGILLLVADILPAASSERERRIYIYIYIYQLPHELQLLALAINEGHSCLDYCSMLFFNAESTLNGKELFPCPQIIVVCCVDTIVCEILTGLINRAFVHVYMG